MFLKFNLKHYSLQMGSDTQFLSAGYPWNDVCDKPAYRRDVFSMSAIHVIAERLIQLTKQLHWLTKVTQHFTATDKKGTINKGKQNT